MLVEIWEWNARRTEICWPADPDRFPIHCFHIDKRDWRCLKRFGRLRRAYGGQRTYAFEPAVVRGIAAAAEPYRKAADA